MKNRREDDSGELLHRFGGGDARAFDVLYERHGAALRGLVWTIVKRADESRLDDLTQKTWTAVIDAAATFERGRDFKAWLVGVARNTCLKDLRERRKDRGDPREDERQDDAPDHEHRAAVRADVRATLAALPAEEREVLEARHGDGLSFAEIAERAGAPVTTIQDRFYRALNKIRPRLKDWAPRPRGERRS